MACCVILCRNADAIQVGGTVTSNTTWRFSDSPVVVTSALVVTTAVSLTIDPGVEVQLYSNGAISVYYGVLRAIGAPANRIKFTRYPAHEYGSAISLTGESVTSLRATGTFDYCDFTLLKRGGGCIGTWCAYVTVSNCSFSNINSSVINAGDSRISVVNNVIRDSTGEPVNAYECRGMIASNRISNVLGNVNVIDINRRWPGTGDATVRIYSNTVIGASGQNADAIDTGSALVDIRHNTVFGMGDKAISLGEMSTGTVYNNFISGCNIGIAVKDASDPVMANNTIINCNSGVRSYKKNTPYGGVGCFTNGIIWNCGQSIELLDGSTLTVGRSAIQGTNVWPGVGNITNDPRFVDLAVGDCRLRPDSPCFDTGVNMPWMTGAMDMDGVSRILNASVDMGVYERNPTDLRYLRIYTPNGGEVFEAGGIVTVKWMPYGTNWLPGDSIRLQLSTDGGSNWSDFADATNIATYSYTEGSYVWDTTGAQLTDSYKLKVFCNATPAISDESEKQFSVMAPVLHHFVWDPILSPKTAGLPFVAAITAVNSNNTVITNFTNAVSISGWIGTNREVTVGADTALWHYPMATTNDDARTEVIYLSSEIGGSMNIGSLALHVVSAPGVAMTNWTIRMQHTSLSEYPSTPAWQGSGWTTVYQTNQYVSSTGWFPFVLQTPFDYNAGSNLLVDFSFNGTGSNYSGFCWSTEYGARRSLHFRTNDDVRSPLSWSGTNNPVPQWQTTIPNLKFTTVPSVPVPVTPASVSDFTGGVWSGSVTVLTNASGMHLHADDGSGHAGDSAVFDVASGPMSLLTVSAGPGAASPPAGTNAYPTGAQVVCSVTNSPVYIGILETQHICLGWVGSGNVPASGTDTNTGPFTLSEDSMITWLWNTNYYLNAEAAASGTVDVADGWFPGGTSVLITALAGQYYHFGRWIGDTADCAVVTNTITVLMNRARRITAAFDADAAPLGTPLWWLVAHTLTNGTPDIEELADPDTDGMRNWEEWIAGTVPTDNLSVLRFLTASSYTNSYLGVSFISVPGKNYRIWSASDLSSNLWEEIPFSESTYGSPSTGTFSATSSPATIYLDASGTAARFYRIGVR